MHTLTQEKIIQSQAQSVVVEAQPGSGKTRILVERLVTYIQKYGIKPESIVAITFTEKAAHEIKERIQNKVDIPIEKCWISTIHGFCHRILRETTPIDFLILTQEQALFLKDQAIEQSLKELVDRRDPSVISLLSQDGFPKLKTLLMFLFSKRETLHFLKEDLKVDPLSLDFYKNLFCVFEHVKGHYEKAKQKRSAYDFDDLLIKCVELLKQNTLVLSHYRKLFKLIMVDEFQDTNDIQREIVEFFRDFVSLMIVGDPKQSIYRFRGAEVSLFYDVKQDMLQKEGFCFEMVENFRSTQRLIEFTNALFKPLLESRFQASLPARTQEFGNPIEYWKRKEDENTLTAEEGRIQEAAWMARHLKKVKKKTSSSSWSDMAILFRAMTFSHIYEEALTQEGIPWVRTDGGYVYESQEVCELVSLLKWVLNHQDDYALWNVCISSWSGLSSKVITSLGIERARRRLKLYDLLQEKKDIQKFLVLLQQLVEQKEKMSLEEWYRLLPLVLRIVREFEAQNPQSSWKDFLQYVEALQKYGIAASEPPQDIEQEGVRLLTIHQSKGLEFDTVLIPDMSYLPRGESSWVLIDKKLGFGLKGDAIYTEIKKQEQELDLAESKRLFYVAVTRAKNHLILSHSSKKPKIHTWARFMDDYKPLLMSYIQEGEF